MAAQRVDRQAVIRELTTQRPRYDLSCWAMDKGEPCVIHGDCSPDELRLEFIAAGANAQVIDARRHAKQQQFNAFMNQTAPPTALPPQPPQPPTSVFATLAKSAGVSGSHSLQPPQSAFGAKTSAFGAASTPQSAFRSTSAFGTATTPQSAFGSTQAPKSAFGQASSAFGPLQSSFAGPTTQPPFGAALQTGLSFVNNASTNNTSIFAQPQPPSAALATLPASTNPMNTSMFGASRNSAFAIPPQQSAFGQPSSLNPAGAPFVRPSQLQGAFGGPAQASAFGQSAFATVAQQPALSAFGNSTQQPRNAIAGPPQSLSSASTSFAPSSFDEPVMLTPEEEASFRAPQFTYGKVPEVPPPIALRQVRI
ncbi:hypothetical protein SeMB42_g00507 [Synchytrium endobioticum]|uniref:Uncharacterized protein n=1 Tax=Synchytrium endobioticum TaxID=286115 RepID=A0A507DQI6_9FUNG|nr:hypothetical protein SeMB42_g00507 [Synchytrium endobioticum]